MVLAARQMASGGPTPGEIVSIQDDPYQSVYGNLLLYHDALYTPRTFNSIERLVSMGRDLMKLAEVQAYWNQRVGALLSKEWEVVPGKRRFQSVSEQDQKAADFMSEIIDSLNWDEITAEMYWGIWLGYGVAEAIWAQDGGYTVLEALKPRKQERFRFDADGKPLLITRSNMNGEAVPEDKFWHFSYGGVPGDPYGQGLAEAAYWPSIFLKGGVKAWLFWLEKNGGTVVVKYPRGASQAEQNKALQLARAYRRDTGMAIPEDMLVNLLETQRTAGDYVDLYRVTDQMLQKLILGQVATAGQTGLVRGEVSKEVRDEIVRSDNDVISQSFTRQIATRLTHWNFGEDAAVPQFWRVVQEPADYNSMADLELKFQQLGWEREEQDFIAKFGGNLRRIQQPSPLSQPGILGGLPTGAPAFAEGSPVMLPEAIGQRTLRALRSADAGLDRIRELANQASSLEDFRDRLYGVFDQMPVEEQARVYAEGGILARLAGEIESTEV